MGNKKKMKRRRKNGPLKPFKRRQTINNYDVLREQQVTVREEGEDVVTEENGDVVPETLSASSRKLDMEPNADNEDEDNGKVKVNTTSKEQSHSSLKLIYWRLYLNLVFRHVPI